MDTKTNSGLYLNTVPRGPPRPASPRGPVQPTTSTEAVHSRATRPRWHCHPLRPSVISSFNKCFERLLGTKLYALRSVPKRSGHSHRHLPCLAWGQEDFRTVLMHTVSLLWTPKQLWQESQTLRKTENRLCTDLK